MGAERGLWQFLPSCHYNSLGGGGSGKGTKAGAEVLPHEANFLSGESSFLRPLRVLAQAPIRLTETFTRADNLGTGTGVYSTRLSAYKIICSGYRRVQNRHFVY